MVMSSWLDAPQKYARYVGCQLSRLVLCTSMLARFRENVESHSAKEASRPASRLWRTAGRVAVLSYEDYEQALARPTYFKERSLRF